MAVVADAQRDEALTQFLTMTEDRVDPDVAYSLLEAVGWNVQTATEQLFGMNDEPQAPQQAAQAMPQVAPPIPSSQTFRDQATQPAAMEEPFSGASFAGVDDSLGETDDMDAQFARALEASWNAQTPAGQQESEEEMMMRAMQMSQAQEEARQRQELRDQQEAELLESEFMDQQREQNVARSRLEEEELRRAAEQSRHQEEQLQREDAARAAAELEAARARIPAEPAVGEPGRLQLMIRLPDGKRLQRAFNCANTIGQLYDFVDVERQAGDGQKYRLISNMPRKAYEDRDATLSDAGIQNQFVFMVEIIAGL